MSEKLFTAIATASGGREGKVQSDDGVIQFETAMPGTPRAKKSKIQQIRNSCLLQGTLLVLTVPFN